MASDLSPWLSKTSVGDIHTVAISHGEGRFVASDEVLAQLRANGQIATQYVDETGTPGMDLDAVSYTHLDVYKRQIPAGSVAASHAIVVAGDGEVEFTDVAAALAEPGTDLRIFAKPEVHGHRRMAVALAVGESEADARAKAGLVADALTITVE